jgi:hypothetical protein
MSEHIALAIVLAAVAAALILYFFYRRSRREIQRLREYEFFCDKFYGGAETLVSESDTPERMLAHIAMLNLVVSDKRIAKMFFKFYVKEVKNRIAGVSGEGLGEELAVFLNAHKNLERIITDTYMGAILAATFLCGIRGVKYRAMLAEIFGRENKPVTAIKAIEESQTHCPALATVPV